MPPLITHNNREYLALQASGFAARFAFPFAREVCQGSGLDIGCGKPEWCFPGAIAVDPKVNEKFDAYNLPKINVDYIFSSHCLEHLPDWVKALMYWIDSLKPGGCLFLYLPDYSQTYWRPWHNRKHLHCFEPKILDDFMKDHPLIDKHIVSGVDLNNSFYCVAWKEASKKEKSVFVTIG